MLIGSTIKVSSILRLPRVIKTCHRLSWSKLTHPIASWVDSVISFLNLKDARSLDFFLPMALNSFGGLSTHAHSLTLG